MDLRSGYPFWLVQSGLVNTYPPLVADVSCEVAVIGGGITGALVAYHLAQAGIDTVVVDKRDIGWGSTSASTGLLQYEIDTPLHQLIDLVGEDHAVRSYLACLQAIDKVAVLVQAVDAPCGFERKQSLYLASRTRDVKALEREFHWRRKIGIHLDWLDESALEATFALKRPAALLSYDAAQIDVYRFTHALHQKAMRAGLRVFDRTEIIQFDHQAAGVQLSTGDGCTIQARKIVFATGYESQQYLRQKVAKLISTYALVSEPVDPVVLASVPCLIWESARPYFYLRTTPDGRLMMGGEDEDFRDPDRRDRLLGRKGEKLQKKFSKLFPHLDEIQAAFVWAGTFGETKDGLPYIGATPEFPNASFALGYGGNGIVFSLIAAEIIRDSFLGQPNPERDLFTFAR
jgi:glycine/D-amino acid oxidase-like deaminating enzyme